MTFQRIRGGSILDAKSGSVSGANQQHTVPLVRECVAAFGRLDNDGLTRVICAALYRPFKLVSNALESGSTLRRAGILTVAEHHAGVPEKLRLSDMRFAIQST